MLKVVSSLGVRVLLLIAIPFAVMLGMTIYRALGGREDRLTNARSHVIAISHRGVTLWKESGARLKDSEDRLRLAAEAPRMSQQPVTAA